MLNLDPRILDVFGSDDDPMPRVEERARAAFPGERLIVWEGDAQTFAFTYVGGDAEALLGHTAQQWVEDPCFWVEQIVHAEDRDDAVAYCALATAKAADHAFEYRALTPDGRIVWLKDYVRAVVGERGIAVRLRGLMIDVSEEKRRAGRFHQPPTLKLPSRAELEALAA
jgi:PAS domain S-box-containing protein